MDNDTTTTCDWQPIETAPKQFINDKLPPEIVVGWYNSNGAWVQCVTYWMEWPNGKGSWYGLVYAGTPTHWSPLPPPPAA